MSAIMPRRSRRAHLRVENDLILSKFPFIAAGSDLLPASRAAVDLTFVF